MSFLELKDSSTFLQLSVPLSPGEGGVAWRLHLTRSEQEADTSSSPPVLCCTGCHSRLSSAHVRWGHRTPSPTSTFSSVTIFFVPSLLLNSKLLNKAFDFRKPSQQCWTEVSLKVSFLTTSLSFRSNLWPLAAKTSPAPCLRCTGRPDGVRVPWTAGRHATNSRCLHLHAIYRVDFILYKGRSDLRWLYRGTAESGL